MEKGERRRGGASGDVKGARICSQDNRTLKLDLFSKGG